MSFEAHCGVGGAEYFVLWLWSRGMVAGSGGGWGGNIGGRWTKVWILSAHVASSLSLSLFYYRDLMCMSFIIQVDFDSGF